LWIFIIAIVLVTILVRNEWKRVKTFPVNSWTQDQRAECAIVLTGGPGRVREGFDLLSRKQIKKLIIAGVHPRVYLRDMMPLWPFYGGLDEKDVILDRRSGTTYGNAQQTLPLVEALHCRDVLIVTSNLHMYRAFKTFQAAYPEDMPLFPRAVPSGRGEPESYEVALEVTKSLFYALWAF
jgi:uncharacterized SAM-binding protein YcdF (DUF218 family)